MYLAQEDDNNLPIWKYQPVHNTSLLILAELGLIGSSLLLGIFLMIVCGIVKTLRQQVPVRVIMITTVLAMFAFTTLFDHWQWDSHFGVIFFSSIWVMFILSQKEE